ncbi:hypothetical protein BHE74_00057555, partial [Ensete ventricosum]
MSPSPDLQLLMRLPCGPYSRCILLLRSSISNSDWTVMFCDPVIPYNHQLNLDLLINLGVGEHDEREVGYSPRAKEAQSGAPTGKRSHKERLSTVETHLDVLEASLEELYQGQGRLLGVESSQEEAESRIDRVESLVDRLTEDTKDSVRHLHEVVAELTAKVTLLTRTLNVGGNNTRT